MLVLTLMQNIYNILVCKQTLKSLQHLFLYACTCVCVGRDGYDGFDGAPGRDGDPGDDGKSLESGSLSS